ncbi:hypothetical protein [Candidatus Clostridium stratigraminis]|uniref:Calcineurin-like phosphoesterase domain-containing protein n=1 Tax=Candidatus Clostridium stratigraminis TaxID=3381661 RepID=A0ABW8T7J7_9CLOT
MKEDEEIANLVDNIDIIINGHSHILMNEAVKINNSIIHMSGCYGEYLGKLHFEYDGRINSFEGININIISSEPNGCIIKSLKANKEKAINKLSEPLLEKNL